ncbi:MAG: hypothetical protein Q4D21_03685 [Phascolarctobacterium sp.]|nr:hypothetical protein [Phascolarctobacterium sp.]
MGSRGSFINVDIGDFKFKDGGKTFISIGESYGVKVLVRPNGSVKAPEFSHTACRIYAIVQNGALKHLCFYDDAHSQVKSIDFLHSHNGLKPHVHYELNHSDEGHPVLKEDLELADKVRRKFGLL